MHIDGSTSSVFSSSSSTLPPVSTPPLGSQFRHAHKIIRRSHPPSRQLRSLGSPIPRFSKSSHRLGPAKDLFNSLSYPLTDTVALMARSAAINGRTALALGVGCYMSSDLSAAQKINKAVSVVVLVRSQRFDSYTLCSLTPDHLLGRLPAPQFRWLD